MEAGQPGARQSGYTPRPSTYTQQHHHLPSTDPTLFNSKPPAMATAALLNPSPAYSHTPSFPYPQSHLHTQQPHPPPRPPPTSLSMPSMSQLSESRTVAQDADSGPRQSLPSLPSLSEVFSAPKPNSYSPKSAPAPPPNAQSVPPPFHAGHSRAESVPDSRAPPGPLEDKFFRFTQRPENNSSMSLPGPSGYSEHRDIPKPPEPLRPHVNHGNAPTSAPPYNQTSHLPPGQYPLSRASISPRHTGSFPPYEQTGPMGQNEEEYVRSRYDPNALNRGIETWSYQESLHKIAWHARTVSNFAEAYGKIAQEQHSGPQIPERLPSDNEVLGMLSNIDYIKQSLTNIRELVHQSIANEKARQGGRHKSSYDGDEDVNMYGDGSVSKTYGGMGEVKKRRGRAAPPGRCHSCNRIDTPEWRRGPDGARTLCNACGLHYAKLERKRQMEQRNIRPKAVEDRS